MAKKKKKKSKIKYDYVGNTKIKIPKFAPRKPRGIVYPLYQPMSSNVMDAPMAGVMGSAVGGGDAAGGAMGGGMGGESIESPNKPTILEGPQDTLYSFMRKDGQIYKAIILPEDDS
jgi:hypothetical protein